MYSNRNRQNEEAISPTTIEADCQTARTRAGRERHQEDAIRQKELRQRETGKRHPDSLLGVGTSDTPDVF
jgi:hypothetical protein